LRKLYLTTVLVLAATVAFAAGPTTILTWIAPTVNMDGSPVTGTITYNVYSGPTTTTLAAVPTTTSITGLTTTVLGTAGTTLCFAVTAVNAGQESAKSNVVCKVFAASIPAAPTNLTIQTVILPT
jgi:hypothetical protein